MFDVGRGDVMGADFVGFLAVGVAVKCGWPGGRGAAILRASKLRVISERNDFYEQSIFTGLREGGGSGFTTRGAWLLCRERIIAENC